jgi:ABC-type bacteriocin/lantibiotic exporter with double-glycine peptidase domain
MMVEALIFLLAAICGLFITGFAVHMFIGGVVSTELEFKLIAFVCMLVACGIGYMAWDVIKRRARK